MKTVLLVRRGFQKRTVLLVAVVVLLIVSLMLNVRQHRRMKPLRDSCMHDLVLLRVMPVIDILSQTNQSWSSDESLRGVRSSAIAIFRFSAVEREQYRSLGLIPDDDVEHRIDDLTSRTKKEHNITVDTYR